MLPRLKVLIALLFFSFCTTFAIATEDPLQVWIMPNGVNPQGILEQRLKLFTKETGIKTRVVVLDWGEAWSRISTALESGKNEPAVIQLGTTWVSHFASHGYLADLSPLVSKIRPDRFIPVSWGTTGIDGDSIVYSVPWFLDVRALLGNRRILEKMESPRQILPPMKVPQSCTQNQCIQ
jgi:multiple sugar transport system substrate-binding protein